jgi:hypothetical protein
MTIPVTLTMTADQHARLQRLLYPGDGCETVALALCGRCAGDRRHRLLVQDIEGVPPAVCAVRTSTRVTWPPEYIVPLLERAAAKGLSVIKFHSHPTGVPSFSETDDAGDTRLLPMIRGWVEAPVLHGSAVMLPDGTVFGRIIDIDGKLRPITMISVVGDDLQFWNTDPGQTALPGFVASHAQAFDQGTIDRLRRLSFAVIGASGTGSPTVEQLMRLGAGEIVLVDDDLTEERNVNRIINSTMQDVRDQRPKVDVLADAIERAELGTRVIRLRKSLWDPEVIRAVAQCDIVFGCMDTVDGRFLLNLLATYYVQPYFDLGVRLLAEPEGPQKGRIREVCGTINYLCPGRSSLLSRGLFTMKQVAAAGLRRTDPAAHAQQVKDGYIMGATGHRPAVISVNMLASALAANELLARLHPFREEPNSQYASVIFSLASMELMAEAEEGSCPFLSTKIGIGDMTPLLGLPELGHRRAA